jgi:chitin disaccharide deacetylase
MSLGLHFVLTGGGLPAAAARELPTLAPGGRFPRTVGELPARIPAEEIRRELDAQIEIFQVLSLKPPTHLDSHHHVALHPSVAPIFAAVARERSLPARASSDEARRGLREAGVRTPDWFVDGFFGESVRFETLEQILDRLPGGTAELMCHPGRVDADLKASSTYVEEREREIEVLTDPRIRELVQSRKIDLVGFDVLSVG